MWPGYLTPVYFYTMDTLLKTLIDRSAASFREMRGKDIYIIVAAALSGQQHARRGQHPRFYETVLDRSPGLMPAVRMLSNAGWYKQV